MSSALAGLTGCSALRLVYSQASEVGYWWLDGYFDFDESQTPVARQAVANWFAWHRRTQLPDYAALLNRAAGEVGQDMAPAQACAWFSQMRERADTAVEHVLPDAASVATTLGAEQIGHLQRKQAKSNKEFREDFLQPDAAERLKKSVDRAVERTEQLYGRLTDAQRQLVKERTAASPFDAQRWQSERERRQRDLLQTLASIQTAPATAPQAGVPAQPPAVGNGNVSGNVNGAALLRGYWQRTMRSPDEAYAAYQQKLQDYNCDFFADLHNQTSAEQRREAQRRLRGWESDVRRLAASAS